MLALWPLRGIVTTLRLHCCVCVQVDINPAKFEAATQWGATDCLNPEDYDDPIQQVISGMTDGGVDYSFEATGKYVVPFLRLLRKFRS